MGIACAEEAVQEESSDEQWWVPLSDLGEYAITLDWEFTSGGSLRFVPAGRQDDLYATRVSTFNWHHFHKKLGGGALIDAMRVRYRTSSEYDYVLIDSRTGVSDTAGICTVQLPDTLVCCFTYNNQSTDGASAVAKSAQLARRHPDYARGGLADLLVYPIPMRVDNFEEDRLLERQKYAWDLFDPILPDNVSIKRKYWTEVEVPYKPALSYEEQLSVFRDEPSDPKGALGAFLRACGYVFGPSAASLPSTINPQQRQVVVEAFRALGPDAVSKPAQAAPESQEEASARRAETIYQRLAPDAQEIARRLWLAFIRVTESYETSTVSSFRIRLSDLDGPYNAVVEAFIDGGCLRQELDGGQSYVAVISPSLLSGWARLRDWIGESSGFLSWRQRLRSTIEESRTGSDEGLRGSKLTDAQWWFKRRGADLLPFEIEFIKRSEEARRTQRLVAVLTLAVVVVIAIWIYMRRQSPVAQQQANHAGQSPVVAEKIVVKALSLDDPLLAALLLAEVKTEPTNTKKYLPAARVKMQQDIPVVVLRGHRDVVQSVDFSPDDR